MNTDHLHPMLVHFPIALAIVGFAFELAFLLYKKEVCLTRAGTYMLILATLAASVAWLSGYFLTGEMSGEAGDVRETHELFATITTLLLVAASVIRLYILKTTNDNNLIKWTAFTLYGLAAICVSITGFFGGTIVYSFMLPL